MVELQLPDVIGLMGLPPVTVGLANGPYNAKVISLRDPALMLKVAL